MTTRGEGEVRRERQLCTAVRAKEEASEPSQATRMRGVPTCISSSNGVSVLIMRPTEAEGSNCRSHNMTCKLSFQVFLALFVYPTHDVIRGYRILLVQAGYFIIKLSFPILSCAQLQHQYTAAREPIEHVKSRCTDSCIFLPTLVSRTIQW